MSALVAATSVSFKSVHNVVQVGNGHLQMIAAAGRNWDGFVSVAFVYGTISAQVKTYNPDMKCDCDRCVETMGQSATVDALAEFAPSSLGVFKEMASDLDMVMTKKGDRRRRSRRRAPKCNVNRGKLCNPPAAVSNDCLFTQSRIMTAGETQAVVSKMQTGLFPKLSAEAELLEVEMKQEVNVLPTPTDVVEVFL